MFRQLDIDALRAAAVRSATAASASVTRTRAPVASVNSVFLEALCIAHEPNPLPERSAGQTPRQAWAARAAMQSNFDITH